MSQAYDIKATATIGAVTGIFGSMIQMPDPVPDRIPVDGSNLIRFSNAADSGNPDTITLSWTGFTGATGYIVQVCENSSFRGTTLKSWKQTETTRALVEGVDIFRHAGKQYYWRFFAYVTGAISSSSEVWSFSLSWSLPILSDLEAMPSKYDLIDWADPSVAPLYQANCYDVSEVMNPLYSATVPIPYDSAPRGTAIEISFAFKTVGIGSFYSWVHSATTVPEVGVGDDISYRLLDMAGNASSDYLFEDHLDNGDSSPKQQFWTWDNTTKKYRQTLFLVSNANVSVGKSYILEISVNYNSNGIGAGLLCVYTKTIVVVQRPPLTSPYEVSLCPNLSYASTNGQYILVKGDLNVPGKYPLDEYCGLLSWPVTSTGWSVVSGWSLLTGLYLKAAISASGMRYGFITIHLMSQSVNKTPFFEIRFGWYSSVPSLGNENDIDAEPIIAYQHLCTALWDTTKLIGIAQIVGDWITIPEAQPTDGQVNKAKAKPKPVASAKRIVLGTDGLPLLGTDPYAHVRPVWGKLTPINFETDPDEGGPDLTTIPAQVLSADVVDDETVISWKERVDPNPLLVVDGGVEPLIAEEALIGESQYAARADHVHPAELGTSGTTIVINGMTFTMIDAYFPINVGGLVYFRSSKILAHVTDSPPVDWDGGLGW